MKFHALVPTLGLLAVAAHAADIAVVEEIIAKVNGDIITLSEIDRSLRGRRPSRRGS